MKFWTGYLLGAGFALLAVIIRDIARSWPTSYDEPTEPGPALPRFSFWSTKDGRMYVWEGDSCSGMARPAQPGELVECGFDQTRHVRQVDADCTGWVA